MAKCVRCKEHRPMTLNSGICYECFRRSQLTEKDHQFKEDLIASIDRARQVHDAYWRDKDNGKQWEINEKDREFDRCKGCGIPDDIAKAMAYGTGVDIWSPPVERALKSVNSAVMSGLRHVVLLGGCGTGKTTIMCRALVDSGYIYRATQVCGSGGELLKPSVLDCRVAIGLDDVGMEKSPRVIDDIVHSRHAKGLVTVVSSNLTLEQFTERYSERTMSRIGEMGKVFVLQDILRPAKITPTVITPTKTPHVRPAQRDWLPD